MSISVRSAGRVTAGAVSSGAIAVALLAGPAPAAQAAPVRAPVTQSAGIVLADAVSPMAVPTGMAMGMPGQAGAPDVLPMWWGHHRHDRHHDRHHGHHGHHGGHNHDLDHDIIFAPFWFW
ncbi:MAG TPA: hypothetical protein VF299_03935 [Mycobacterium sp.]